MLRIVNVKLDVDKGEDALKNKVAFMLKTQAKNISHLEIRKKAVDARNKSNIKIVYTVDIEIKSQEKFLEMKNVALVEEQAYIIKTAKGSKLKGRPVVVGAGPCGLFAALVLAECGHEPIILERGKKIDARRADVASFWGKAILDLDSNVQFGEGGAGAFSDGKLTTGIKDERINYVISKLVEAGAPPEISYLSKPHIGTDRLVDVVKNIRQKIISLGGEFRFGHKLIGISCEKGQLSQITIQNDDEKYELETSYLALAIGHSARDTVEMLYEGDVYMEAKAFAVGVRIEHEQSLINKAQYGRLAEKNLSTADYKLSTHLPNKRGVYTFCMCPGGVVVGAASEEGGLVTNGMSLYSRDGQNANSALLVSVFPSDFRNNHPLAGIEFQRSLEKRAFLLGGGDYKAPVQLVGDFLENKETTDIGDVLPSYRPGFVYSDLRECLDPFITESIKAGITNFQKKLKGFAKHDSVLTAVETRSSSPVIIKRNQENYQSNIKGIYPCGEGAGYAGGIISAAVDGVRVGEIMGMQGEK